MAFEGEGPLPPLPLADWCALRAALQEQLKERPLKPDGVAVLETLARMQPLTASALAEALAVTKAKTTRLVRHLSQLDLVVERIDARDRRQSFFRIAPRGENVLFELGLELGRKELEAWAEGLVALHHACRAARVAGGRPLSEHQCALLMICAAACPDVVAEAEAGASGPFAEAGAGDNSAPWVDGSTMAAALAQLALGQSTVSMAVRALRRDGLLETRAVPSDRRQGTICLTSRGRVVASAALKAWNQQGIISA